MAFDQSASLKDRFENARQCLVEMFPRYLRPGKTYQGLVKALRRIPPEITEQLQIHLCRQHQKVAGSSWLLLTILYRMGSGLPWRWAISAGTDSERGQLRGMLKTLPLGSLIVADAALRLSIEIGRTRRKNRRLEHPKSAQPTLMKLLVLKGVTRWHKPEKFTALHATLLISYTLNPASQFLVAIRAILFYTYISGK